MENATAKNLADKLIEGLKKTVVELEEFRVQLALGKAEASEIYERLKKEFRERMQEARIKFEKGKQSGEKLTSMFQELQLQLALGRAETKEAFVKQKKVIMDTLRDIEDEIKKNGYGEDIDQLLHGEIEKFRIKMQILKLRYELKKSEAREEFQERKAELIMRLDNIRSRIEKKETVEKNRWDEFKIEINQAYEHLRRAFE